MLNKIFSSKFNEEEQQPQQPADFAENFIFRRQ